MTSRRFPTILYWIDLSPLNRPGAQLRGPNGSMARMNSMSSREERTDGERTDGM